MISILFRARLAVSVAGLFVVATAPTVWAQETPTRNVDDLEKQIQSLRQTVEELRRSGSNAPAAIQVETPPASDNPAGNRGQATARRAVNTNDPIERIRDEGLNRSQVMKILGYLSDVIGGRLTGSPNMKRANEWTRDQLTSFGLVNGHLEAWGPFGRGWELKRFSAQVIEPQAIPIKAHPSAWSPGLDNPIEAEVVYLDARTDADLEKYKGHLKGAVILASPIREIRPRLDPMINRYGESNLLNMANASPPRGGGGQFDVLSGTATPNRGGAFAARRGGAAGANPAATNAPAGRRGGGARGANATRFIPFLMREGAALMATPSGQGDSGTFYVQSAAVPPADNTGTNAPAAGAGPGGGGGGGGGGRSIYGTNAPDTIPQMIVAAEDYNRMLRMLEAGEKLRMAVDLKVKYYNNDPMAYNTVAEIPGTDLKDEIVMLGGHMDSWHSGSGATDNGAGVAAAMEVVRIIKTLDLKPRRTIRIALWSGEEQGLLGSRAYVSQHFGYYTNATAASAEPTVARSPNDTATTTRRGGRGGGRGGAGANATRKLVKGDEYEKLSAYFNLDNGGGKIRGVYMQGNEGVRPLFRQWLEPFRDLGAETLTALGTGGTDHLSFDGVGLPGFQFIQDALDYNTRTHHSNEDVFDRINADDMKQAATIMAAFVYQAAMLDSKLPRKAAE